ncbi:unnamed protein product [Acanthoscelides obtectus]|uniref:Large ribosomal subunit protein uL22 n=1 Tax=Acanthoscelides obtectus TaxID=200917 RepID=A0A9P0PJ72_ACAOB|nr:unnamed protein product [Acanthoscelides obtectus]CAK1636319.1 60S ribosomal protein L17 [Acanthoscelides obtectus]
MGKGAGSHHYSLKNFESGEIIRAKASNLTVKFKNMVEVASAIRKMTIARANAYLKNVLNHTECVPFRRFKSGIGKCPQAKQFKIVNGRWPKNAAKCMINLLRNVAANSEFYGKDPADYIIGHIQVNRAAIRKRRTFRAHGRINPYARHLSHVQVVLTEKPAKK